ncbi:PREDICTED: zinc finger CCHC domain-containing protein 3-like [Wasmannia auropunctata]|uniref:zinc finger CCHC domain-containing protein 3-like n=1 Tax=Wasmannia auropunctata TaxID=64793 RepID=UPI0005EEC57C|nr:PREDICTED: zinc finger CCHC domain-containing protein 3-like [Wasmannia auropunctata]
MSCKTAHDMWVKITSIFQRDNEQQKCTLFQNFFSFEFDKNVDIATNIGKLRNLAVRLKGLDNEINDNIMLMSKILSILPEEFRYFTSAWESTVKEDRTLENLISRLLAEESRRNVRESQETAFKTAERKCFKCGNFGHTAKICKKGKKCYICNKEGHYASTCTKKSKENKEKYPTCSICKKNNHQEKDCFFRQKDVKKSDKFLEKRDAGVSFLTRTSEKSSFSSWIMDSGSTSHMSRSMEGMKIMEKIESNI